MCVSAHDDRPWATNYLEPIVECKDLHEPCPAAAEPRQELARSEGPFSAQGAHHHEADDVRGKVDGKDEGVVEVKVVPAIVRGDVGAAKC